jgi:hypothetical protein
MAFRPGSAQSFAELKLLLGVAVRRGIGFGYHAGLIFRQSKESRPRFLDLPRHGPVRDRMIRGTNYWWDDCALDPVNAALIAARCHAIAIRQQEVNYGIGFRSKTKYWDTAAIFVARKPTEGLTCATLILSIFGSLGHRIIDEQTWQIRPEDQGWQNFIISNMEREWGVSKGRIRAQRKLIGIEARIRPVEAVTATAVFQSEMPPQVFSDVRRMGAQLEEQLPVDNGDA